MEKQAICALLVLVAIHSNLLLASGQEAPPSLEKAAKIVTEEEIMKAERPSRGFIAREETHVLLIRLRRNQTLYPNILLTLTSNNEEGDADLYCYPSVILATDVDAASKTHWTSTHSEGKDFVFMSRETELYNSAKKNISLASGERFDGVDISCGLIGESFQGTDYLLEIDVDYESRTLVEAEQSAMASIFDKCCRSGPALCLAWKNYTNSDNTVSMDFCHRPGSICNADGRLVRLDLGDEDLMCDFPTSEISKLAKLEKLEMNDNNLKGNISTILAGLSKNLLELNFVSIEYNSLTGKLDADVLCKMTHKEQPLTYLNLRDNSITGSLPACLFDGTSKLKELIMSRNNLEGSLPSISPTSMMQDLHVSGAGLSGKLDNSLASLENLMSLQLSDNKLEGTIPDSLGSSSNLGSISMSGNYLIGVIPGSLAASPAMRYLMLDENQLEGFAEEWYTGSLSQSKYAVIYLSHNSLEGEFPRALADAPDLLALHIEENYLTGKLPNKEGMFPNLLDLDVQGNSLEGEISPEFGHIRFFDSRVAGKLTKMLPLGGRISMQFDVSQNSLSGTLPAFLHPDIVPNEVHGRINLEGNDFNISCPVLNTVEYLKKLECIEIKESENAIILSGGGEKQANEQDEQMPPMRAHSSSVGRTSFWGAIVGAVLVLIGVVAILFALSGRMRRKKRIQLDNLVGDVELRQS